MTIRELIDDTIYLAEGGRYVGALTTVLAAISGSARKVFPRRITPSRIDPKDRRGMGDREAFTLFLGGRISCLANPVLGDGKDEGTSGWRLSVGGESLLMEEILYEHYRCALSHDGQLPATVSFGEEHGFDLNDRSYRFSYDHGVIRLERGWIALLIRAVTHAKCNGAEFGIEHYELRPRPEVDIAAFTSQLVDEFRASPGRIDGLKLFIHSVGPNFVAAGTDNDLNDALMRHRERGGFYAASLMGLRSRNLATDAGLLTPQGLALTRRLAAAFELVRVI